MDEVVMINAFALKNAIKAKKKHKKRKTKKTILGECYFQTPTNMCPYVIKYLRKPTDMYEVGVTS